jgi:aryl-alcohol dehydrogenase-like predicted oxidoreductase
MNYRTLGKTGIQVSQLCFGTMSFGGDADEPTSQAMFRRCRELGINFFDCADIYAGGVSEQILGRLVADCRDELVLTTKVCMPRSEDVNDRGLSRRSLFLAIEASLKRLNTDRIEVYFAHHFDAATDMEVTLKAFDDLVRQGKILHPAVSNWSAWQIALSLGICSQHDLAHFECIQPMYNLVKRQAEVEILPLAAAQQIGVIPYSPLGGGLLTGKYSRTKKPDSGRIIENKMYDGRYADQMNYEVAERFTQYAHQQGRHPATLAVAWVMTHPAVTAPIIGARNLEQLEPSLAAMDVDMTQDMREEISGLSVAPPLATDRAEEG